MKPRRLLIASLRHYRRTHAAVVLGVATAVAVLAGALLVGGSVRSSLRELVLERLGRTDAALTAGRYFRETLLDDLEAVPGYAATVAESAPLIAAEGIVTHETSGRRASGVSIWGVDERFFVFHNRAAPALSGREALPSEGLATELGLAAGDTLLVRVGRLGDVPGASLYGRRDDLGRTLRVRARETLVPERLGDFSLTPHQQTARAVFVPLAQLQRSLGRAGQVNALLFAARGEDASVTAAEAATAALRAAFRLEDLGLALRPLPRRGALSLESDSAMLDDGVVAAAREAARTAGLETSEVLTYLANSIRARGREVPYSLISALDPEALAAIAPPEAALPDDAIVLNSWAADELRVSVGATVELEYFLWEEQGRLRTETAALTLAGIAPLEGAAADPDLAPEYPGISASEDLGDWDPPFPIDLSRVRDRDERYWDRYRTTPKGFVTLARGERLWRHRLGRLTSLRLHPPAGVALEAIREPLRDALHSRLDPFTRGYAVAPVREQGLAASRGATDFGEYFFYFSFFLIVSALLLAGLFFRLGAEQRLAELGLLSAVGFPPSRLRRLFLREAGVLALLGSALGIAGAWLYASLMMLGLRTWWVDAVGTSRLRLEVSWDVLALGAGAGLLSAVVCLSWTLRGLLRVPPRRLLAGEVEQRSTAGPGRRARAVALIGGAAGLASLAAAAAGALPAVAGFFGAGGCLLVAALAAQWLWLAAGGRGGPPRDVTWLGFRSAAHRPGRSLLCVALIASATFVIVSVSAFRHPELEPGGEPAAPSGGYALFAESLLPIHHDPNTPEGREALALEAVAGELERVSFTPFRLRPGDDASCLNLYRPREPRILAPPEGFVDTGRFSFSASLAETEQERANPWLLLRRDLDGAIPVIGDQNSLAYVLHVGLGEELRIERAGAEPLRLRVVAALRTGLFQGELLMSEQNFLEAFPELGGFRFFAIEAPGERLDEVAAALESRLEDYGLDVRTTSSRLAEFQRVENTYLATFQTLGALGLLLGTVGLATVLLRNALERRRELALLRAVGYRRDHLARMVLAENALLLALGLATGTVCALIAIAPAAAEQGARFPVASLLALLGAVLATGLAVSWLATAAIVRTPLLPALRAD